MWTFNRFLFLRDISKTIWLLASRLKRLCLYDFVATATHSPIGKCIVRFAMIEGTISPIVAIKRLKIGNGYDFN